MTPGWREPRPGHTHVFAIVRVDSPGADSTFNPDNHVMGTKAYLDRADAKAEAERLQALNADKRSRYVVVTVRLVDADRNQPSDPTTPDDLSGVVFVDDPELLGTPGSVRLARIGSTSTKNELIEEVARALSFPEPFGRNWDAFDEMLNRLEWLTEASVIVAHDEVPGLSEADLRIYVSILGWAHANWASSQDRSFVAVFPSSARGLIDSVSAT
jgi:Barstar (barnase inhibitor)